MNQIWTKDQGWSRNARPYVVWGAIIGAANVAIRAFNPSGDFYDKLAMSVVPFLACIAVALAAFGIVRLYDRLRTSRSTMR